MYLNILFLNVGNEMKKNVKLFKYIKKLQACIIATGVHPLINKIFSLYRTSKPISFKNIAEMIT
tara:strand:- start:388 stop:579 length:192 start_codon:yes stop_codon:yes gene_type:complete